MEGLEKMRTVLANALDRVRKSDRAFGQAGGFEPLFALKNREDRRSLEHLERAINILRGTRNEIRYKTLTLGELDESGRRHFVGKHGHQRWNDGELVVAFEDGTVAFWGSGAEFWGPLHVPDEIAGWIAYLDNLPAKWESGPTSGTEDMLIH